MQKSILFTSHQAAEFLNLSPKTLCNWRCHGKGPKFCKIGRNVRYRQQDLEDWLVECTYQSTLQVALR